MANPYSLLENRDTCTLAGCQGERREEGEGANSWDEELSSMKTSQPPMESLTSGINSQLYVPQLSIGWEAVS